MQFPSQISLTQVTTGPVQYILHIGRNGLGAALAK